uniref:Uncharacterized protein n=1 Tax=Arundo donax TaxID=35708 RepID=A0A0A8ZQ39_ARUDO
MLYPMALLVILGFRHRLRKWIKH